VALRLEQMLSSSSIAMSEPELAQRPE